MSSLPAGFADRAEAFLATAGFDRAPWMTVAFAGGVGAWFVLPGPVAWLAMIGASVLIAIGAQAAWRGHDGRAHLHAAVTAVALLIALGTGAIWMRSATVGAEPLARPGVSWIDGRVLSRQNQPAEGRVRLVLAYRDAETGTARKVRLNVPTQAMPATVAEGARVRVRARLMPPAPPMVPGAYDFARTAWFAGLAATGSAIGDIEVVEPTATGGSVASIQRALSAHVRSRLDGSAGSIAAAFASGDRGGIAEADEVAMRDSGLTHLLSISGVHVSAVIAAAYVLALRLLALWPWLVLRIRLPLVAAVCGAGAGIAYTLLTGAEVPTVRSVIGALLVLAALAMGREALSMRMVATAAFAVLLIWPEALMGPSFQMSFAAVVAIVALHEAAPIRAFLVPREESWLSRTGRRAAMLLLTGVVIELALMPIVLFHFHRAGFYGAIANVVAIPLVTVASMPLIALALVLDLFGLGGPVWWLAGQSLDLLLGIAHYTAAQPGAVRLMPQMGWGTYALFIAGLLWLALWKGRRRLWGFVSIAIAGGMLLVTPTPDMLVSGDGRHVGIAGEGDRLLVLREGRSDYARDNLLEMAGMKGDPLAIADWPGARCSADFCALAIDRGGKTWTVLLARSRSRIEERALAAACERSDIVVADRWLPASCRPRWLKADRRFLDANGGLAITLDPPRLTTVAARQGDHPWWTARRNAAERYR
ncbi:ComEC/Rec2 family competence protein [Tsuneonella amylolytica]|uniref:ComEC/Rec2 family competence protein n=1 Tax=Tsuneonella amylolytica TaxID=2338327 RepID=UPI002D79DAE7|nr:ComEC/Rec2 family competence protein [Tsuneonella amylolytica]